MVEAFFAERGLVKQQIDSFDQFMYTTMQEVVDESFTLEFDVDTADDEDDRVSFFSCSVCIHTPLIAPLFLSIHSPRPF